MARLGVDVSTGERILYFRKVRGLTQAQLAGQVDRSERWLYEVEHGRQEVDRLSLLLELAGVLRCRPKDLLGGPFALAPNGGPQLDGMPAVRRALLPYDTFGPAQEMGAEPDLADVRARVARARRLRQACRYFQLGAELPALIALVRRATRGLDGEDRLAAFGQLAEVYYVTAALCQKVGDLEEASSATTSAIWAAERSDDPLMVAIGARRQAMLLLRLGRNAEAKDVALTAAMRIEPLASAESKEATSVWGALLLKAAIAASRTGDRPGASDYLAEAAGAAERNGNEDRNDLWTAFGATNVAAHRVSTAIELGEVGEALSLAASVDAERFPPELAERRTRYLIDVARGYRAERKDEAAISTLLQAESFGPEEVRYQVIARDIVRAVLRRRRSASSVPGVARLAERMGLLAA